MAEVNKTYTEVLHDNDELYIDKVLCIIESVDLHSHVEISKVQNKLGFRVASTLPKYNALLLEELLAFHNLFGIHLDISKSIKTSGIIDFSVKIN